MIAFTNLINTRIIWRLANDELLWCCTWRALRWCAEGGMQEMPSRLRAKNSQLNCHNHFIMETSFFFPFRGEFLPANARHGQPLCGWMAAVLVHGVNLISARDEWRIQTCRDFPSPFLSNFVNVIFPWGQWPPALLPPASLRSFRLELELTAL